MQNPYLTNLPKSPIVSISKHKGDDEEEYALPLVREGGREDFRVGRRPEGRDAEGSFRAGMPKGMVMRTA